MSYMPAAKRRRTVSTAVAVIPQPPPFQFKRRKYYRRPSTSLGGEFKAIDVTTGSMTADTSGTFYLLNPCARGDDIAERVGRETIMRSIQIKGKTYGTASTGTLQIHRIIIFYDRQSNGAAPAATDLLVSNDDLSLKNLNNKKRFKILYDQRFTIESNVAANTGALHTFDFYRKLRHPCSFNNGDNGNITDFISGSLYVYVLGTNAAGATAGATQIKSRIRFQDN